MLEPIEFEAVYRGVLGQQDERPERERDDGRDRHARRQPERELYGALLSTAFYAGPRLGELRDLPWRNVDFDGAMIRIESGFSEGRRSTPKGKRARSTPLVPILSQRLAALATRERFTGDADYVFSTELGERVGEKRIRRVFYAALGRAGLGHRRDDVDPRGNPQLPIRLHDLRHSWCTWAVNVWHDHQGAGLRRAHRTSRPRSATSITRRRPRTPISPAPISPRRSRTRRSRQAEALASYRRGR